MINVSDLKIGDVLYMVVYDNNAFSRNKIKKIDEDGIEWYRYDAPLWTAKISKICLVGIARVTLEGRTSDPPETSYFFDDGYKTLLELYDCDFINCPTSRNNTYHYTMDEAVKAKTEFESQLD